MTEDNNGYAEVAWTAADICDVFDVTEEEAEAFLSRHERAIAERMTERGWDAIETLAHLDGLRRIDEDEDA